MARQGKERYWRRIIRQWRRSGRSVRQFCGDYGVSEPSFYAWRRLIAQRDQQATVSDSGEAVSAFGEPVFVPVSVVGLGVALELVLGRDRVVRVPAGFDADTLRQLLVVLEEAPPC